MSSHGEDLPLTVMVALVDDNVTWSKMLSLKTYKLGAQEFMR
jgi:hypothetical protein